MATYKEIHGTDIEVLSSDPANPVEGQVWYNSTSNVVKGVSSNPGSWATGGDLGTARYGAGGSGTQTAGIAFGGTPPSTGATELYNGSSWTEVNDMNAAGHFFGSAQGTQTSTVAFGGQGSRPSGSGVFTETWNGTNWTETTDLNTARYFLNGLGTQTAALAVGGAPPDTGATESWNGTNWTEVNDLNTANTNGGASGTTTSALRYGGFPGPNARNESWNGTNWTEVRDLNTARRGIAGTGPNNNSALAAGGGTPSAVAATEEWNAGPQTVT